MRTRRFLRASSSAVAKSATTKVSPKRASVSLRWLGIANSSRAAPTTPSYRKNSLRSLTRGRAISSARNVARPPRCLSNSTPRRTASSVFVSTHCKRGPNDASAATSSPAGTSTRSATTPMTPGKLAFTTRRGPSAKSLPAAITPARRRASASNPCSRAVSSLSRLLRESRRFFSSLSLADAAAYFCFAAASRALNLTRASFSSFLCLSWASRSAMMAS